MFLYNIVQFLLPVMPLTAGQIKEEAEGQEGGGKIVGGERGEAFGGNGSLINEVSMKTLSLSRPDAKYVQSVTCKDWLLYDKQEKTIFLTLCR
jgi:hypothetical protein